MTSNLEGRARRHRGTQRITRSRLVIAMILVGLAWATPSSATSQWSRKYQVACSQCHTAFPRLNFYGERFLRNGFQLPDLGPDGDTEGKTELAPDLAIDQLQNYFGVRLNLDAVRVRSNHIDVGGDRKSQVTFGNPNWAQIFVAGSLFRNVSVFIENELEQDGFKFNWFYIGFHNLADTSALNLQVGNLSPLEFASHPNRLRILAPVKGDVFGVTTTGGASAADNLSVSGARPGVQYYGYKGPLIWWAGVTPGSGNEVNDQQHYWGGARLDIPIPDVNFEGTNVSVWSYRGTDTVPKPSGALNDVQNDFDRWSVQGNLRWRQADIQGAWVEGTDDNWDLSLAVPPQVQFSGISLVGAWQAGRWYPAVAYDKVRSDDASTAILTAAQQRLEKEFTTVSLSYLPRENWRVGAFWRIDMQGEDPLVHPWKKHDFRVNIRTMF